MKNETIKTYTEITVEQAGEMLRDNGWRAVGGVALKHGDNEWNHVKLKGISVENGHKKFVGPHEKHFSDCATVTELDPCVAPEGCPELEPWMAYVGMECIPSLNHYTLYLPELRGLTLNLASSTPLHVAVDVRTAWAQEHFPEHCRIRNYQEPDAFEEFEKTSNWKTTLDLEGLTAMRKQAFEAGQANPNQPTK